MNINEKSLVGQGRDFIRPNMHVPKHFYFACLCFVFFFVVIVVDGGVAFLSVLDVS